MSTSMKEAALTYARRGWAVFPLHSPLGKGCSCRKGAECSSPGKHPRTDNGLKDASTDDAQVSEWWSRWPNANIGIVTGERSGLLVVDLDDHGHGSGAASLQELSSRYGAVPSTLTARTGSGIHLYFKHPGKAINNSVRKIGAGIDVRCDGGYVVAAPSRHASGQVYGWIDPERALADVPVWLLEGMATQVAAKEGSPTTRKSERSDSLLHEGKRNDGLFRIACELRGQQAMDEVQLRPVLHEMNMQLCVPPLPTSEVDSIVQSACKFPAELGSSKKPKRADDNPLHWFPVSVRSWLGDQDLAVMSDTQTGQYMWLMVYAWQRGGFLPADSNKLWKLAHAPSKRAFERERAVVLAEYEEVEINGERLLKNPAMVERWTKTYGAWMAKKKAGEASAAQRALLRQQKKEAEEGEPATNENN